MMHEYTALLLHQQRVKDGEREARQAAFAQEAMDRRSVPNLLKIALWVMLTGESDAEVNEQQDTTEAYTPRTAH